MQMVAEMWLILELTGSGVAVGVTSALQFLPILALRRLGRGARRPLAEALAADRHPDARWSSPALALWALTAGGAVEPWMVFALVFVRGAVNAIDNPTRQSFVIEMVGADRVVNAVGLNSVLIHSARIVGPAGAGILIATRRRRPLLPDQRGDLRGDDRRPARDGPGAARRARRRRRTSAAGSARRSATCAASRAC